MTQRIEVTESVVPSAVTSAVRQIALVIGGWAIGKGYLDDTTLTAIITVLTVLVPLVYGQYKNYKKHAELVTTAEAAPNNVAVVK